MNRFEAYNEGLKIFLRDTVTGKKCHIVTMAKEADADFQKKGMPAGGIMRVTLGVLAQAANEHEAEWLTGCQFE